ncbi:MAG: hypothetical protein FWE27_09350 [Defluviitaleaceae bacterium]|nr:hypothetical protein [Defluviitaleaceae bacterium]
MLLLRMKLSKMLLSLVVAFGFNVSPSVIVIADIPVSDIPAKSECYEIFCEACQHKRLRELLDNGSIVVALDSDGKPFNIPRVNIILPPERHRDYFYIGVVDELTCYEVTSNTR